MAIAKSTGVDYTIPPNRKGSGSKNNHGSATRTGSSTNLSSVVVSRDQMVVFGSTVIDDNYSDKAVSAGTFRYNDQRPVGMRVSSSLAGGVSNTSLLGGADVPGQIRSIHKRESFKVVKTASGIRENKYNRSTNTWAAGYPQTGTETPGTDVAATPTRSSPGQLTYKLGQPVPVSDNDYKAKTG